MHTAFAGVKFKDLRIHTEENPAQAAPQRTKRHKTKRSVNTDAENATHNFAQNSTAAKWQEEKLEELFSTSGQSSKKIVKKKMFFSF